MPNILSVDQTGRDWATGPVGTINVLTTTVFDVAAPVMQHAAAASRARHMSRRHDAMRPQRSYRLTLSTSTESVFFIVVVVVVVISKFMTRPLHRK